MTKIVTSRQADLRSRRSMQAFCQIMSLRGPAVAHSTDGGDDGGLNPRAADQLLPSRIRLTPAGKG
jgi:hypothetical protein